MGKLLRRGAGAVLVAAAIALTACGGDSVPTTEWSEDEVIDAAGLQVETDSLGSSGYQTTTGCHSRADQIYTSREDLAEGVSDLEVGNIDPGDEDAIRAEAEDDNVAVNPDLTAGVGMVGEINSTGEIEPETDCIPDMEEGLAALTDEDE